MRTIHAVKESSERIVAAGRDRMSARRANRYRDDLLQQLGQICLDDRSGATEGDVDAEINRVVARLLLLEESGDEGTES